MTDSEVSMWVMYKSSCCTLGANNYEKERFTAPPQPIYSTVVLIFGTFRQEKIGQESGLNKIQHWCIFENVSERV